ncbi:pentapeptide repeat-containing protein [Maliponia aquimaris]|uniref:Secreted effector protein pipB2 n=1 Tax=Maliponia aquimaris TaxID=1673631 RepID=A0A238L391_9RHOB|nr:pentapeptide repeat-containing protein [Maliponia aquimaris]SMX49447.1 Secreted effector protein pipB2 [Maliponia aquimaris]
MSNHLNLRTALARTARKRHLSEAENAAGDAAKAVDQSTVDRIAKLTGMARASWLGLLSFLAFIGITLLGVQDADFFIVERETDLPLVGVSVPTNLFFYVAPLFGALLYVHMHLYLVKLWKALDSLPRDNGSPAEEVIAPWIVSDMVLSRHPGAVHAYPMRTLARVVVFLSIFAFGPFVLAAFWWRSMPKHDELLTVVFCGLPLFVSVLAGVESWRALRRGGAEASHMSRGVAARWIAVLLALSMFGFLTTEGTLGAYAQVNRIRILGEELEFRSVYQRRHAAVVAELGKLDETQLRDRFAGTTDYPNENNLQYLAYRELKRRWWMKTWWPGLLRPAQLAGVSFVETPPDWRPRDEAEQLFRPKWCAGEDIPMLACGPGPLARDDVGEPLPEPEHQAYQRNLWCEELMGTDIPESACLQIFDDLNTRYVAAWKKARKDALAALPQRKLAKADLRRAVLAGARMNRVDLREARMEGAVLQRARMEGAVLALTRMEHADLRWARMEKADLSGAWMEEADLRWARMEGADLRWARMEGAEFWGARIMEALRGGAWITWANLREARMDATTDLTAADVTSAAVRSVDFTTVSLSQDQINGLFGDASVTLPEGIAWPKHWPTWVLPWDGAHAFDTEWRKWQADPQGYRPPPPPDPTED